MIQDIAAIPPVGTTVRVGVSMFPPHRAGSSVLLQVSVYYCCRVPGIMYPVRVIYLVQVYYTNWYTNNAGSSNTHLLASG